MANDVETYNLFTYCENDSVNFIDFFGHIPNLITLTKMHNAVIQSAQFYLFSIGIITSSEVRTYNCDGIYNGRMDIYSYVFNFVWEVKPNNERSILKGKKQLLKYISSYLYPLYHSRHVLNKKPAYALNSVYGATIVSNYLVTYHSLSNLQSLIVYDYFSLEQISKLLFNVVITTSSAFASALARCSKKIKEKVIPVLAEIKKFMRNVKRATQEVLNAIVDFLKKAGPIILIIIAIIVFLCTGIPVFV